MVNTIVNKKPLHKYVVGYEAYGNQVLGVSRIADAIKELKEKDNLAWESFLKNEITIKKLRNTLNKNQKNVFRNFRKWER